MVAAYFFTGCSVMASNGGAPAAAGASGGPGGDHPGGADIGETDDLMPQLAGWCHENQGRFPGIINADTNKIDIDVLLHDADAYVHFLVFACSRMSNSDQQLRVRRHLAFLHVNALRMYIMDQALAGALSCQGTMRLPFWDDLGAFMIGLHRHELPAESTRRRSLAPMPQRWGWALAGGVHAAAPPQQ